MTMDDKASDKESDLGEGGGGSLLRAARSGNVDKLINLLDQENVDISTANSSGLTALHLAAKEGHCDIINELLLRAAPINQTTKRGNTGLHIASLAGKLPVVKLLIEKGADANSQAQNAFTPLYMASQEGHEDIVDYLLKNGANQSISTEDGFTPLAVALQEGKDRVVALLLDNDVKGRVKLPALHIAARKDDVKAAALLLQSDNTADTTSKMVVNRTSESGFTALHIAAHYGNVNVATLLLNRGAVVDFKARNGITPMHVAAKRGHTRFCGLLLDRHGRPDICTRDGLVPLHCAARSGHLPIVKLFLDNDNTPKFSKTKNGLTALHMAAQGGHTDVMELLLERDYSVDDVTSDYLSVLHIAAHCGHVDIANIVLKHDAYVDCKALNGFTPLHVACKKNRLKVVDLLLSHSANKEAVTESGLTPLHIACFMGHSEIVEILMEKKADLNTVNVRGETALHMATRSGQTDIVTYLLRHGAKPDARKQESQTCLHLAARLDKLDILKILLEHGAVVDEVMEDGYTPLHVAAKEGHVDVCETLLDNGASVALTTKKGFTPLHLASKYGRLEVSNLLLKRHSSPDASGKDGLTPLHVAAHYDNQQVALLLLKNGASPHASGKNGYTPLHIAAKKNQMEIALTLMEYGASPNSKTKMDVTPLHLSSQEGHTDMCSVLVAKDANVNASAKHGLTPMHLAAQEDRISVAKVLYDNGSLVDPLTRAGCTPLHVASHHGNIKVANYLLSLGAKVNAKTKNGYTPLHQASQQGHTHVVNLLLSNGASPNELTNSGNTALSLAKRLGYVTVVDTLQTVTTEVTTTVTEEKRKLNIPETVNEGFLSDASDDEGDESMIGGGFLTSNELKELGDDSIVPTEASMFAVSRNSRYATLGHSMDMPDSERRSSWSSSNSDVDNIKSLRSPRHSGFLVSFMVDARGGAMRGSRHPDMRILVPPKACRAPTRVTCRLARRRYMPGRSPTNNPSLYDAEGKAGRVMEIGPRDTTFLDQLHNPRNFPPLTEGEGMAARVMQLSPKTLRFLGPVAIEFPHFANVRDNDRQLVVLRSNDGETWKTHEMPCTDEHFRKQFEEEKLESAEELASRRILRVITTDFPRFFAVVSRPLENSRSIGSSGGELSSTVLNNAKARFPEGSLTKKINVSMQILPISADVCRRAVGGKAKASAILTIEPRRRKFHKPIVLNIPLPEGTDMKDYLSSTEDSTLRLLCSISGGSDAAQWEDITGSTPLNFLDNCVSFTSTVSARFWLIDCRQPSESSTLAHQIYDEATRVPYMAKFIVFAKSHDPLEAKVRVFCMTDDKYDKTLEKQENFTEVARSKDIEVLEGSTLLVECSGNLSAPLKSGQQHKCKFNAFHDNRIQLLAKVRDSIQDPCGRLMFYRLPMGAPKTHGPRKTICSLNIKLPHCERDSDSENDEPNRQQIANGKADTLEQEVAEAKRRYYLVDPTSVDMTNKVESSPEEIAKDMVDVIEKLNQVKEILQPHGDVRPEDNSFLVQNTRLNKPLDVGVVETTEVVMEVKDRLVEVKEILESDVKTNRVFPGHETKQHAVAVERSPDHTSSPTHAAAETSHKCASEENVQPDDSKLLDLEYSSQIFERHVEVSTPTPVSSVHVQSQGLTELHGRDKHAEKDVRLIAEDFNMLTVEIEHALQDRRERDPMSIQFEQTVEAMQPTSHDSFTPLSPQRALPKALDAQPALQQSSSADESKLIVAIERDGDLKDLSSTDKPDSTISSLTKETPAVVDEECIQVIVEKAGVGHIDEAISEINSDAELARLLADDLKTHESTLEKNAPLSEKSTVEENEIVQTQRKNQHNDEESVTHGGTILRSSSMLSCITRSASSSSDMLKTVRFLENVTVIDDESTHSLHSLDKDLTLHSSNENVFADSSDAESSDSDTGSVSFSPPLSDSEDSSALDEEEYHHPTTLQERISAYQAATTKLHKEVEKFKKITSPQKPLASETSPSKRTVQSRHDASPKKSPVKLPTLPKLSPLSKDCDTCVQSNQVSLDESDEKSEEVSPVVVEESHSVHELLKAWEKVQTPTGTRVPEIKSPKRHVRSGSTACEIKADQSHTHTNEAHTAQSTIVKHQVLTKTHETIDIESSCNTFSSENTSDVLIKVMPVVKRATNTIVTSSAELDDPKTSSPGISGGKPDVISGKLKEIAESQDTGTRNIDIKSYQSTVTSQLEGFDRDQTEGHIAAKEDGGFCTSFSEMQSNTASNSVLVAAQANNVTTPVQNQLEIEKTSTIVDNSIINETSSDTTEASEITVERNVVCEATEASDLNEFEALEQRFYTANTKEEFDAEKPQSPVITSESDQSFTAKVDLDQNLQISNIVQTSDISSDDITNDIEKDASQANEVRSYLVPEVIISKCSEERLDILAKSESDATGLEEDNAKMVQKSSTEIDNEEKHCELIESREDQYQTDGSREDVKQSDKEPAAVDDSSTRISDVNPISHTSEASSETEEYTGEMPESYDLYVHEELDEDNSVVTLSSDSDDSNVLVTDDQVDFDTIEVTESRPRVLSDISERTEYSTVADSSAVLSVTSSQETSPESLISNQESDQQHFTVDVVEHSASNLMVEDETTSHVANDIQIGDESYTIIPSAPQECRNHNVYDGIVTEASNTDNSHMTRDDTNVEEEHLTTETTTNLVGETYCSVDEIHEATLSMETSINIEEQASSNDRLESEDTYLTNSNMEPKKNADIVSFDEVALCASEEIDAKTVESYATEHMLIDEQISISSQSGHKELDDFQSEEAQADTSPVVTAHDEISCYANTVDVEQSKETIHASDTGHKIAGDATESTMPGETYYHEMEDDKKQEDRTIRDTTFTSDIQQVDASYEASVDIFHSREEYDICASESPKEEETISEKYMTEDGVQHRVSTELLAVTSNVETAVLVNNAELETPIDEQKYDAGSDAIQKPQEVHASTTAVDIKYHDETPGITSVGSDEVNTNATFITTGLQEDRAHVMSNAVKEDNGNVIYGASDVVDQSQSSSITENNLIDMKDDDICGDESSRDYAVNISEDMLVSTQEDAPTVIDEQEIVNVQSENDQVEHKSKTASCDNEEYVGQENIDAVLHDRRVTEEVATTELTDEFEKDVAVMQQNDLPVSETEDVVVIEGTALRDELSITHPHEPDDNVCDETKLTTTEAERSDEIDHVDMKEHSESTLYQSESVTTPNVEGTFEYEVNYAATTEAEDQLHVGRDEVKSIDIATDLQYEIEDDMLASTQEDAIVVFNEQVIVDVKQYEIQQVNEENQDESTTMILDNEKYVIEESIDQSLDEAEVHNIHVTETEQTDEFDKNVAVMQQNNLSVSETEHMVVIEGTGLHDDLSFTDTHEADDNVCDETKLTTTETQRSDEIDHVDIKESSESTLYQSESVTTANVESTFEYEVNYAATTEAEDQLHVGRDEVKSIDIATDLQYEIEDDMLASTQEDAIVVFNEQVIVDVKQYEIQQVNEENQDESTTMILDNEKYVIEESIDQSLDEAEVHNIHVTETEQTDEFDKNVAVMQQNNLSVSETEHMVVIEGTGLHDDLSFTDTHEADDNVCDETKLTTTETQRSDEIDHVDIKESSESTLYQSESVTTANVESTFEYEVNYAATTEAEDQLHVGRDEVKSIDIATDLHDEIDDARSNADIEDNSNVIYGASEDLDLLESTSATEKSVNKVKDTDVYEDEQPCDFGINNTDDMLASTQEDASVVFNEQVVVDVKQCEIQQVGVGNQDESTTMILDNEEYVVEEIIAQSLDEVKVHDILVTDTEQTYEFDKDVDVMQQNNLPVSVTEDVVVIEGTGLHDDLSFTDTHEAEDNVCDETKLTTTETQRFHEIDHVDMKEHSESTLYESESVTTTNVESTFENEVNYAATTEDEEQLHVGRDEVKSIDIAIDFHDEIADARSNADIEDNSNVIYGASEDLDLLESTSATEKSVNIVKDTDVYEDEQTCDFGINNTDDMLASTQEDVSVVFNEQVVVDVKQYEIQQVGVENQDESTTTILDNEEYVVEEIIAQSLDEVKVHDIHVTDTEQINEVRKDVDVMQQNNLPVSETEDVVVIEGTGLHDDLSFTDTHEADDNVCDETKLTTTETQRFHEIDHVDMKESSESTLYQSESVTTPNVESTFENEVNYAATTEAEDQLHVGRDEVKSIDIATDLHDEIDDARSNADIEDNSNVIYGASEDLDLLESTSATEKSVNIVKDDDVYEDEQPCDLSINITDDMLASTQDDASVVFNGQVIVDVKQYEIQQVDEESQDESTTTSLENERYVIQEDIDQSLDEVKVHDIHVTDTEQTYEFDKDVDVMQQNNLPVSVTEDVVVIEGTGLHDELSFTDTHEADENVCDETKLTTTKTERFHEIDHVDVKESSESTLYQSESVTTPNVESTFEYEVNYAATTEAEDQLHVGRDEVKSIDITTDFHDEIVDARSNADIEDNSNVIYGASEDLDQLESTSATEKSVNIVKDTDVYEDEQPCDLSINITDDMLASTQDDASVVFNGQVVVDVKQYENQQVDEENQDESTTTSLENERYVIEEDIDQSLDEVEVHDIHVTEAEQTDEFDKNVAVMQQNDLSVSATEDVVAIEGTGLHDDLSFTDTHEADDNVCDEIKLTTTKVERSDEIDHVDMKEHSESTLYQSESVTTANVEDTFEYEVNYAATTEAEEESHMLQTSESHRQIEETIEIQQDVIFKTEEQFLQSEDREFVGIEKHVTTTPNDKAMVNETQLVDCDETLPSNNVVSQGIAYLERTRMSFDSVCFDTDRHCLDYSCSSSSCSSVNECGAKMKTKDDEVFITSGLQDQVGEDSYEAEVTAICTQAIGEAKSETDQNLESEAHVHVLSEQLIKEALSVAMQTSQITSTGLQAKSISIDEESCDLTSESHQPSEPLIKDDAQDDSSDILKSAITEDESVLRASDIRTSEPDNYKVMNVHDDSHVFESKTPDTHIDGEGEGSRSSNTVITSAEEHVGDFNSFSMTIEDNLDIDTEPEPDMTSEHRPSLWLDQVSLSELVTVTPTEDPNEPIPSESANTNVPQMENVDRNASLISELQQEPMRMTAEFTGVQKEETDNIHESNISDIMQDADNRSQYLPSGGELVSPEHEYAQVRHYNSLTEPEKSDDIEQVVGYHTATNDVAGQLINSPELTGAFLESDDRESQSTLIGSSAEGSQNTLYSSNSCLHHEDLCEDDEMSFQHTTDITSSHDEILHSSQPGDSLAQELADALNNALPNLQIETLPSDQHVQPDLETDSPEPKQFENDGDADTVNGEDSMIDYTSDQVLLCEVDYSFTGSSAHSETTCSVEEITCTGDVEVISSTIPNDSTLQLTQDGDVVVQKALQSSVWNEAVVESGLSADQHMDLPVINEEQTLMDSAAMQTQLHGHKIGNDCYMQYGTAKEETENRHSDIFSERAFEHIIYEQQNEVFDPEIKVVTRHKFTEEVDFAVAGDFHSGGGEVKYKDVNVDDNATSVHSIGDHHEVFGAQQDKQPTLYSSEDEEVVPKEIPEDLSKSRLVEPHAETTDDTNKFKVKDMDADECNVEEDSDIVCTDTSSSECSSETEGTVSDVESQEESPEFDNACAPNVLTLGTITVSESREPLVPSDMFLTKTEVADVQDSPNYSATIDAGALAGLHVDTMSMSPSNTDFSSFAEERATASSDSSTRSVLEVDHVNAEMRESQVGEIIAPRTNYSLPYRSAILSEPSGICQHDVLDTLSDSEIVFNHDDNATTEDSEFVADGLISFSDVEIQRPTSPMPPRDLSDEYSESNPSSPMPLTDHLTEENLSTEPVRPLVTITSRMLSTQESCNSLPTPRTADSVGEVSAGDEFSFHLFPRRSEVPLSVDSAGTVFQFSSSEMFPSDEFYASTRLSSSSNIESDIFTEVVKVEEVSQENVKRSYTENVNEQSSTVRSPDDTNYASLSAQPLVEPTSIESPTQNYMSLASEHTTSSNITTTSSMNESILTEQLVCIQQPRDVFSDFSLPAAMKDEDDAGSCSRKEDEYTSTSADTIVQQDHKSSFTEKFTKFVETIESSRQYSETTSHAIDAHITTQQNVHTSEGYMEIMDTNMARAQAARFEDMSYMSMAYDQATNEEMFYAKMQEEEIIQSSPETSGDVCKSENIASDEQEPSIEMDSVDSTKCAFLETILSRDERDNTRDVDYITSTNVEVGPNDDDVKHDITSRQQTSYYSATFQRKTSLPTKPKSSRIPVARSEPLKKQKRSLQKQKQEKSSDQRLSKSLPTRSRKQKLDKASLHAHDESTKSAVSMVRASSASKLPVRRNTSAPHVRKKQTARKNGKQVADKLASPSSSTSSFSRSSSGSSLSMKFRKSGGSSPVQDSIFRSEAFTNKAPNSDKYIALREGVFTYKMSPAQEREKRERSKTESSLACSFDTKYSTLEKTPGIPRPARLHRQQDESTNERAPLLKSPNGNQLSRENPFLAEGPRLEDAVFDTSGALNLVQHATRDTGVENRLESDCHEPSRDLSRDLHTCRTSPITIPTVASTIGDSLEDIPNQFHITASPTHDSLDDRLGNLSDDIYNDYSSALSTDSMDYSCNSVIREIEAEADAISITPDSMDSPTAVSVFPIATSTPDSLEKQTISRRLQSSYVDVDSLEEFPISFDQRENYHISPDSLTNKAGLLTNETYMVCSDDHPVQEVVGRAYDSIASEQSLTQVIRTETYLCSQPDTSSKPDFNESSCQHVTTYANFKDERNEIRTQGFFSSVPNDKALEQKHQAVASQLGIQWPQLAGALGLSPDDVWKVQKQCDGGGPGAQSSAMMRMWLDAQGEDATDERLRAALKEIKRTDLVALLEDPVFHYEDNIEPPVDKHMHHDVSGFNALSDELGSPFPTPGHVSSPYPFPSKRQDHALSTSTPATKAMNETNHDEQDSSLVAPPSAGYGNEEDDSDKPHFIYVADEDNDVMEEVEEQQPNDVAMNESVPEPHASSRGSSASSSSTTSGEHDVNEVELTDPVEMKEPEDDVVVLGDSPSPVKEDDVKDLKRRSPSPIDDVFKLEQPEELGINLNGTSHEEENGPRSEEVMSTTTITRTIVVETDEPNGYELPTPRIEVSGDGSHVIEISRQIKQTIVNDDASSDKSSSSEN